MRPGESAKLTRFHPESFEKYWFAISVDPTLATAEFQLGIVRERRDVTLHKGSVTLPAITKPSD